MKNYTFTEKLARNNPLPIEMVAAMDTFGDSETPDQLMEKYGLKAENIVEAALKVIKRRKK